ARVAELVLRDDAAVQPGDGRALADDGVRAAAALAHLAARVGHGFLVIAVETEDAARGRARDERRGAAAARERGGREQGGQTDEETLHARDSRRGGAICQARGPLSSKPGRGS